HAIERPPARDPPSRRMQRAEYGWSNATTGATVHRIFTRDMPLDVRFYQMLLSRIGSAKAVRATSLAGIRQSPSGLRSDSGKTVDRADGHWLACGLAASTSARATNARGHRAG